MAKSDTWHELARVLDRFIKDVLEAFSAGFHGLLSSYLNMVRTAFRNPIRFLFYGTVEDLGIPIPGMNLFATGVDGVFGWMDDFTDALQRAVLRAASGISLLLTTSWPAKWNQKVVKQNDAATMVLRVMHDVAIDAFQGPDTLSSLQNAQRLLDRVGRWRKLLDILNAIGKGNVEKLWQFLRNRIFKRIVALWIAIFTVGQAIAIIWFSFRIAKKLEDESLWQTLDQTKPRKARRFRGVTREKSSQKR